MPPIRSNNASIADDDKKTIQAWHKLC